MVGVIYDRRHTRLVKEFGGLAKVMPVYAAIFGVVTMASVGVPGTNGFVGEFMVITGTFVSEKLGHFGKVHAVLAAAGVILAAVYMLTLVQKVFFGPLDNPKNQTLKDLTARETIALAPLVAMIFVIGLFPALLLSRMTPSVESVLSRYVEGRKAWLQMEEATQAQLLPRRGGALERGYPLPPEPQPTAQVAQADRPEPQKGAQR